MFLFCYCIIEETCCDGGCVDGGGGGGLCDYYWKNYRKKLLNCFILNQQYVGICKFKSIYLKNHLIAASSKT